MSELLPQLIEFVREYYEKYSHTWDRPDITDEESFFCAKLKREDTNFFNQNTAISLRSELEKFANNGFPALPQYLVDRIISLNPTSNFDPDIVHRALKEYREYLISDHVDYRLIIPIQGLKGIANEEYKIIDDFYISELAEYEKQRIIDHFVSGGHLSIFSFSEAKYNIIHDFSSSKNAIYDKYLIPDIVLLLRSIRISLDNDEVFGGIFPIIFQRQHYFTCAKSRSLGISIIPPEFMISQYSNLRPNFTLDTTKLNRIRQTYRDLGKIGDKLETPLSRFSFAYSRLRVEDSVIDITIALESLLLHGTHDELKYRLSLRGAALLERDNPGKTMEFLKRLYDIRSEIVHNGKKIEEIKKNKKQLIENPETFRMEALSMCRRILLAVIDKLANDPKCQNMDALTQQLDQRILDSLKPSPSQTGA